MQAIDLEHFCKLVNEAVRSGGMSFALFLGAGCSVSSGVLSASTLCLRWVREMKRDKTKTSLDFEKWYAKDHPGFQRETAGTFYATAIRERFPDHALRRMAVQQFVSEKDPAVGYYALSSLITDEKLGSHFNVIFTTNFDDLVSDAVFLFHHKKSLVIPHEDLAEHASANSSRPLIVKLHGDANLSPLNTSEELKTLSIGMSRALTRKLDDRGLIFLGYSGFDNTVAQALNELWAEVGDGMKG